MGQGESKTMKDHIREQRRVIDHAVRSLEREKTSLEREEKKTVIQIKALAAKNQLASVKIMAKDLVRMRNHQNKMIKMVAELRAVRSQMSTMAATQQMSESMKSVTTSMIRLNKALNLPQLQSVMREFAKQSELMETKQEMMGSAIEDAMDTEEDEAESEQIVNQVLDEIGVNLSSQLATAPKQRATATATEAAQAEAVAPAQQQADRDLEARLQNLGR